MSFQVVAAFAALPRTFMVRLEMTQDPTPKPYAKSYPVVGWVVLKATGMHDYMEGEVVTVPVVAGLGKTGALTLMPDVEYPAYEITEDTTPYGMVHAEQKLMARANESGRTAPRP